MGDYIKKIRTTTGDKQIDYTALANLPISDKTLSKVGEFADAAAVGVLKQDLDVLNQGGLVMKDTVISKNVQDWLDAHPEITTTVQDGSLTEQKIQPDFLKKIKKDYVTPEMFGAVGDENIDDTLAIQQACDYATKNHMKLVMSKNYKITNTIIISVSRFVIDATSSKIIYTGTEHAFKITKSSDVYICFGYVFAQNGSCIEFFSKDASNFVQYINLYFLNFKAKNNCITFSVSQLGGWTTEIRIHDGMFSAGMYGVYADANGRDAINGIRLYNVGVEGVKTGFYLANGVQCWDIITPRCSENFERVFETVGNVIRINFICSSIYYFERDTFSNETKNFNIIAPCANNSQMVLANVGMVDGCVLVKSDYGYLNASYNSLGEFYDIGSEKEYQKRVAKYIYCGGPVRSLKLSKEMGRINGQNEFHLFFYNDTTVPFKIIDANGSVIYDKTVSSVKLDFIWFNEVGWKCFKVFEDN